MAQGKSLESFAADHNLSKVTVYNWTKQHADFLNAFELGKTKRFSFFERMGLEGMFTVTEREGRNVTTKSMNAAVYKLFMANLFDWTDKSKVESETKHDFGEIKDDDKQEAIKKLNALNETDKS